MRQILTLAIGAAVAATAMVSVADARPRQKVDRQHSTQRVYPADSYAYAPGYRNAPRYGYERGGIVGGAVGTGLGIAGAAVDTGLGIAAAPFGGGPYRGY